jgi:hypothetical protein
MTPTSTTLRRHLARAARTYQPVKQQATFSSRCDVVYMPPAKHRACPCIVCHPGEPEDYRAVQTALQALRETEDHDHDHDL